MQKDINVNRTIPPPLLTVNSPAITVIIPMYNAEKYIAQCLTSILRQKFQDFEVIVVDDCSTDGSVNIVENAIEHFDGRLKLVKQSKNSGGPAAPRNIGLDMARGKYISFIDNDDLFMENAFEDFYKAAEQTQADVVHAERHLENPRLDENFFITSCQTEDFVDKITIETNDIAKRIELFNKKRFWYVWNKIFRRDFLMEHNIKFPDVTASDDLLFSFFTVYLAKKYVRIPNITNIYRRRNTSLSQESLSVENYVNKWTSILIKVVNCMDKFMSEQEFFNKNPEYKFIALQTPVQDFLNFLALAYRAAPMPYLASILQKQFEKNPQENIMLTNYLFNLVNKFHVQYVNSQLQNMKLQQQITQIQKN